MTKLASHVTSTAGRWSWRRRLVLASISVVVLTIVAEVGLRLLLGLGNPIVLQRDDAAGYVVAPSQHSWRFFCTNDINRYSMRSMDIAAARPAGTFRVLFVGDSVTYGTTFVDQSRIFTSILARALPGILHRPTEVLNASAGGWAVGNELGYLRSRGTLGSNVVIFVLNTGDLVQAFNDMKVGTPENPRDPRPISALSELWERYLLPRLRHQEPVRDAGSTASAQTNASRDTPPVLRSLADARNLALANGAQFSIVYSPCRGPEWESPEFGRGLEMLRQWATINGVTLIDLGRAYSGRSDAELYFDGVHLRPAGHAVVAAEIEKAASQWVSAPAATRP